MHVERVDVSIVGRLNDHAHTGVSTDVLTTGTLSLYQQQPVLLTGSLLSCLRICAGASLCRHERQNLHPCWLHRVPRLSGSLLRLPGMVVI